MGLYLPYKAVRLVVIAHGDDLIALKCLRNTQKNFLYAVLKTSTEKKVRGNEFNGQNRECLIFVATAPTYQGSSAKILTPPRCGPTSKSKCVRITAIENQSDRRCRCIGITVEPPMINVRVTTLFIVSRVIQGTHEALMLRSVFAHNL